MGAIGEGLSLGNKIAGWINGFFKRKNAKDEKEIAKDIMSGNSADLNKRLDKLYPQSPKGK